MNEFELIHRYFLPLTHNFPEALSLSDDAAVLTPPEGFDLVITKDALSEGVHFLGNEDPALIAKKLLRTNLSDLAAKGAKPWCYFLAVIIPKNETFIQRFAQGLLEDQTQFGIHLAGGDTSASKSGHHFSLTALGLVPRGTMMKRSGAKAGDSVFVTGTLGDSALGLKLLQTQPTPSAANKWLIQRYLVPEPRLEMGVSLRGRASACLDISDGLLQDALHLCTASKVSMEIDLESLPISTAAQEMLRAQPELEPLIYSGGDDYELLFTAATHAVEHATRIGRVRAVSDTPRVTLLKNGHAITPVATGYQHF